MNFEVCINRYFMLTKHKKIPFYLTFYARRPQDFLSIMAISELFKKRTDKRKFFYIHCRLWSKLYKLHMLKIKDCS